MMLFKWFRSAREPMPAPSRRASDKPRSSAGPPCNEKRTDWGAQRSVPSPGDQQLSALAQTWLLTLPEGERPVALCERFARIINRLALVWPDAELTECYFESLLIDHRGGRKGFPPDVMTELIQLRARRAENRRSARAERLLEMKAIDFDVS